MASNPPTQPVFAPGRSPYSNFQTLADGINFLTGQPRSGQPRFPFAVLTQSVAQSIASTALVPILLDLESIDTDSGHSTTTNTSRYTAQTSGWYDARGNITFAANTSGIRQGMFRINGSTYFGEAEVNATGTFETAVTLADYAYLNAGDYLEILGYQNSGGAINTGLTRNGSRLSVRWIAP